MKTKKRSAFTLVELLMATTLTAMVMGGGVPVSVDRSESL